MPIAQLSPRSLDSTSEPVPAGTVVDGSVLSSRGHRILIAVLLIASLVPVWAVTYFPSQNGPWHLLVSKMLHDYFAGTPFNYFDYYQLAPHPIPHLLHTLLVTVVSFVVPVLIAHKLVVSLYVVLLPLSVFAFLSAVDPRKTIFGYTSFLFVYSLPLMRGYHDYSLGIPVVFFTLAYWLRTRAHMNARKMAVIAGLILLAYLSHFFNFLILGLVMLVLTLYETRSPKRLLTVLMPFVPASLLLLDFALLMMRRPAWMSRSDLEILAPRQAVEHFLSFVYTFSPTAAAVSWIPFVFVVYAIGQTLRRASAEYRETRRVTAGNYLVLMVVLFAAYLAMPHKFFGWHFANTRFIPFAAFAALACASPEIGRRARRYLVGATVIAASVVYALLTIEFVHADRKISEYVSAVEYFRQDGLLYPIDFRADNYGQVQPLTRAHEYYHIFRGGANGRGIAMYNTLTPMPYRVYPVVRQFPVWRPDDADRRATDLANRYDHVISWGTQPEFAESVSRARFRLVHHQGDLYFYTNETRPGAHLAVHSGVHR
jgi:hypothetical protein